MSIAPPTTNPARLPLLDRLRIERATWTLDARLQDLPRRSRITKRRELRDNLRAAADEVGARQAVRQLGDLRVLAADYLAAEYGELARRPSWYAGASAWILIDTVMMLVHNVASSAFRAGVHATSASATGTFRWSGVPYLISPETFTYRAGASTSVGGAWTPWVYVITVVATVAAGRLWRVPPRRRTPSIGTAAYGRDRRR